MRKLMLVMVMLGVGMGTAWTFSGAAQKDDDDEKKKKYTIKEVMAKAHKGKDALLSKYKDGKATKEELKELVAMYQALEVNKPPKGKESEWKERTKKLVEAANAAAAEKKEAKALLVKATNCAACHKAHKED